jgi:glycosyltransferase involved in cell wall biosynthesis
MNVLSIIVLSYNRPKGLDRILKNFLNYENANIELIIKDDRSTLSNEIYDVIDYYKKILKISFRLHINPVNLGYDMNLLDSFNITKSKFIFLLSDDDYINPIPLNDLVDLLLNTEKKLFYTPYYMDDILYRSKINEYEEKKFSDVIYNSILFSGLIFDRQAVLDLDLDLNFLSNSVYSQVFLAGILVFKNKSFGISPVNILYVGSDGENFFGKNEAAKNMDILKNRDTVYADLNYQQFLLGLVNYLSLKTKVSIKKDFWENYRIRLIGMGFRVRSLGIIQFINFSKVYYFNDVKKSSIASIIFVILIFCPAVISNIIYNYGVRVLRKSG